MTYPFFSMELKRGIPKNMNRYAVSYSSGQSHIICPQYGKVIAFLWGGGAMVEYVAGMLVG